MAKIPFNFGGGSGNGSDDCTAEASDVLTGVTAIYKGSDDEPQEGTMANHSGVKLSATSSLSSSNNRFVMTFPATGKYTTVSALYTPYANVALLIGLTSQSSDTTSSKLAVGNTCLGITGSYSGLGNATVDQVLSGKTFSTATLSNATGTMANVGSVDAAKSVTFSSGTLHCYMTNGAHITNASSGYPQVSVAQGTLATAIGLSASQIVYGNTILGIAGTAVSPGSTAGYDLYAYGQEGITVNIYNDYTGSATSPSNSTSEANKTSCCLTHWSNNQVSNRAVVLFSGAPINFDSYSTVHVEGRAIYTVGTRTIVARYSDSSSTIGDTRNTISSTAKNFDYSTTTVEVDISSVTGSHYLSLDLYNSAALHGGIAIDHIWLT